MSTQYALDANGCLELEERSSKFILTMDVSGDYRSEDAPLELPEMTGAEAMEVFIKGLQAVAYNMTYNEFDHCFRWMAAKYLPQI